MKGPERQEGGGRSSKRSSVEGARGWKKDWKRQKEKQETNEVAVGKGKKALAGPSFISAEEAHPACRAHYL